MNGNQVRNGKAFEYACLIAFKDTLSTTQAVTIQDSSSVNIAQEFYLSFSEAEQRTMILAAEAAVNWLIRTEPFLTNPENDEPLYLAIQEDSKGQAGDVRDVLMIRKGHDWEIGVSVKHNHDAVKHSRLSDTLDFGEKWFGIPCSKEYFGTIQPIFDRLRELKKQHIEWKAMGDKVETVYLPILNAFKSELIKLDTENPGEVPKKLIPYLLGTNDFYKIISNTSQKNTKIETYSLYGTLNRSAGKIRPQVTFPQLRLPNKFYEIGLKPETTNTLLIACDEGWQFSLRIHNASTLVEPSLKFDIRLVGSPSKFSHFEPWKL